MKIRIILVFFILISFKAKSGIPPFYIDFGYNFSRSALFDFNEFVGLYNENPNKIGGYTFEHGFDKMHWLNGMQFGVGARFDDVNLEFNYSKKFNHTFAYYDPSKNPTYLRVDLGISVKTYELAFMIQGNVDRFKIFSGFGLGYVQRSLLYFDDDTLKIKPGYSDMSSMADSWTISFRPMVQISYKVFPDLPVDIFGRFYYQMMFTRMSIQSLEDFEGYWTTDEAQTKKVGCGNLGIEFGVRFNIPSFSFDLKPRPQEPEPLVDTDVLISGKLVDANNGNPLDGVVTFYKDGKPFVSMVTENGYYAFKTSPNQKFTVESKSFGYQVGNEEIVVGNNYVYHDLKISKIPIGQSIKLENILFEKASAVLLPESYPELDKLLKFMQVSPTVVIEIAGHTSSEGNDSYNMKLSQDRAKSIAKYLVDKGIAANRIVAKGYGETKPVATNDTEDGRKLNRRVEFKIMSF